MRGPVPSEEQQQHQQQQEWHGIITTTTRYYTTIIIMAQLQHRFATIPSTAIPIPSLHGPRRSLAATHAVTSHNLPDRVCDACKDPALDGGFNRDDAVD